MSTARIALVEDEPALAEVIQYNLEREGYGVEVYTDGEKAWAGIRSLHPDLILMDILLPGIDGLELTRMLKRDPETAGIPVVMLTAKAEEVDRIVGLELGADDYVTKPFSPREVVLRVKAVLRRTREARSAGDQPVWLQAGTLRIDPEGYRVMVGEEEVHLTATEFRLLALLMERAGRTQTRSVLLSEVWGYADDVDSRTVDTHIRRLRKKLGAEAERVETVIGVGYRLRR